MIRALSRVNPLVLGALAGVSIMQIALSVVIWTGGTL